MKRVTTVLLGIVTFYIGFYLTTMYVPIKDVYLQSIESIRLAILFLASIISMIGYLIYDKI